MRTKVSSNGVVLAEIQSALEFSDERAELEAVLNSGIFVRSPSLAQFLLYVCQRYFEGEADKIKEYNVAVEALGRPPEFDQKKDSIVRVEAHRLRKRLQEYYREEGANHTVQIFIPPGNYVPQFVRKSADIVPAELGAASHNGSVVQPSGPSTSLEIIVPPTEEPALTPEVIRPGRPWPRLLAILAALAIVALAAFLLLKSRRESPAASPVQPQAALPPEGEEIRIAAGSGVTKLLDHYGNAWGPDRFFEGGTVASSPSRPIMHSPDFALYVARREGKFSYHIPVKPGTYELRLYFAETVFGENNMLGGGESTRVFHVDLNGKRILSFFDVIGDAPGSNTADVRVFKDVTAAPDGKIHLLFDPANVSAFVNAIEIIPAAKGYMRPVRIIARDGSFTDHRNLVWASDRFFQGGVLIQRHQPVSNTDDDLLYQSERYGNFTYTIPVAESSHYSATLRFCENWWGVQTMGGGGIGSRVFDVYLNGRALLKNFDVIKEAGGARRPLDKTFKNLEPSAQGKLVFQFVPSKNYAFVNALEVVDEGR